MASEPPICEPVVEQAPPPPLPPAPVVLDQPPPGPAPEAMMLPPTFDQPPPGAPPEPLPIGPEPETMRAEPMQNLESSAPTEISRPPEDDVSDRLHDESAFQRPEPEARAPDQPPPEPQREDDDGGMIRDYSKGPIETIDETQALPDYEGFANGTSDYNAMMTAQREAAVENSVLTGGGDEGGLDASDVATSPTSLTEGEPVANDDARAETFATADTDDVDLLPQSDVGETEQHSLVGAETAGDGNIDTPPERDVSESDASNVEVPADQMSIADSETNSVDAPEPLRDADIDSVPDSDFRGDEAESTLVSTDSVDEPAAAEVSPETGNDFDASAAEPPPHDNNEPLPPATEPDVVPGDVVDDDALPPLAESAGDSATDPVADMRAPTEDQRATDVEPESADAVTPSVEPDETFDQTQNVTEPQSEEMLAPPQESVETDDLDAPPASDLEDEGTSARQIAGESVPLSSETEEAAAQSVTGDEALGTEAPIEQDIEASSEAPAPVNPEAAEEIESTPEALETASLVEDSDSQTPDLADNPDQDGEAPPPEPLALEESAIDAQQADNAIDSVDQSEEEEAPPPDEAKPAAAEPPGDESEADQFAKSESDPEPDSDPESALESASDPSEGTDAQPDDSPSPENEPDTESADEQDPETIASDAPDKEAMVQAADETEASGADNAEARQQDLQDTADAIDETLDGVDDETREALKDELEEQAEDIAGEEQDRLDDAAEEIRLAAETQAEVDAEAEKDLIAKAAIEKADAAAEDAKAEADDRAETLAAEAEKESEDAAAKVEAEREAQRVEEEQRQQEKAETERVEAEREAARLEEEQRQQAEAERNRLELEQDAERRRQQQLAGAAAETSRQQQERDAQSDKIKELREQRADDVLRDALDNVNKIAAQEAAEAIAKDADAKAATASDNLAKRTLFSSAATLADEAAMPQTLIQAAKLQSPDLAVATSDGATGERAASRTTTATLAPPNDDMHARGHSRPASNAANPQAGSTRYVQPDKDRLAAHDRGEAVAIGSNDSDRREMGNSAPSVESDKASDDESDLQPKPSADGANARPPSKGNGRNADPPPRPPTGDFAGASPEPERPRNSELYRDGPPKHAQDTYRERIKALKGTDELANLDPILKHSLRRNRTTDGKLEEQFASLAIQYATDLIGSPLQNLSNNGPDYYAVLEGEDTIVLAEFKSTRNQVSKARTAYKIDPRAYLEDRMPGGKHDISKKIDTSPDMLAKQAELARLLKETKVGPNGEITWKYKVEGLHVRMGLEDRNRGGEEGYRIKFEEWAARPTSARHKNIYRQN